MMNNFRTTSNHLEGPFCSQKGTRKGNPPFPKLSSDKSIEEQGKKKVLLETKRMKGIIGQKLNGVPILGSRRVRQVVLAAVFPEFYTTEEVDTLHGLLDEAWTARCQFFGQTNQEPDQNRLMWRYRAGQFEEIRWTGSRSIDRFGLSPWWAGGIIFGLLNEMPREYFAHIGAYVEILAASNMMTAGARVKA
ncbi:hypothetical protein BT69DRAFT_1355792 [Atractiella rhizophila]|nr:hypothetical protein BT69DRAFT_1355792 [Atractiella rhizophila]